MGEPEVHKVEALKNEIRRKVAELKALKVETTPFLLELLTEQKEEKLNDEEKKEGVQVDIVSLLCDINGNYEYGVCPKGHQLVRGNFKGLQCSFCKKDINDKESSYCRPCQAPFHVFCGKESLKRVKNKLAETERIKNFVVSELEK